MKSHFSCLTSKIISDNPVNDLISLIWRKVHLTHISIYPGSFPWYVLPLLPSVKYKFASHWWHINPMEKGWHQSIYLKNINSKCVFKSQKVKVETPQQRKSPVILWPHQNGNISILTLQNNESCGTSWELNIWLWIILILLLYQQ